LVRVVQVLVDQAGQPVLAQCQLLVVAAQPAELVALAVLHLVAHLTQMVEPGEQQQIQAGAAVVVAAAVVVEQALDLRVVMEVQLILVVAAVAVALVVSEELVLP